MDRTSSLSIRANILCNMRLPAVPGFSIKSFGEYLPSQPFQTSQASNVPWHAELERRKLSEVLSLIPKTETPDILVIASPEYLPIPIDIEDFKGLKILLITDWNVCLRFLPALCSLFDLCFTDWPGYRMLKVAGIKNIRHQPMFGHNPEVFRNVHVTRNLDVSFCGNLNAGLHGDRNRLLARIGKWAAQANTLSSLHLRPAFGADYVNVLNRSRLVFNYSIRGEANMRLFETMACGGVPLVEESNQEVGILFEENKHFFRYAPHQLEKRLTELLSQNELLQSVSEAVQTAVIPHTKVKQIQSILELACAEKISRPLTTHASDHNQNLKSLIKLRVLGAGYTLKEAFEEIQSQSAKLSGLGPETMPAILFSLLSQSENENPLPTILRAMEQFLQQSEIPEIYREFISIKLCLHKKDFEAALVISARAKKIFEDLVAQLKNPTDDFTHAKIFHLYNYFHPPLDLGKGFNSDLNRAFRLDLKIQQPFHYLELMQAHIRVDAAKAHVALKQPEAALTELLQINLNEYASLDAYRILIDGLFHLHDHTSIRKVVDAWFNQKPLDTQTWDCIYEVYGMLGNKADLVKFLEEIAVLAKVFLDQHQSGQIQSLLLRETTL